MNEHIKLAEEKMDKALQHLAAEFASIRAGRESGHSR